MLLTCNGLGIANQITDKRVVTKRNNGGDKLSK